VLSKGLETGESSRMARGSPRCPKVVWGRGGNKELPEVLGQIQFGTSTSLGQASGRLRETRASGGKYGSAKAQLGTRVARQTLET